MSHAGQLAVHLSVRVFEVYPAHHPRDRVKEDEGQGIARS
jgi:hypothetical protein